jgi:allantoinase
MLFLRSTRVAFPDGLRPGSIVVRDGRITAIDARVDVPDEMHTLDVGPLVVMPGLVDTHVHVNEPGRTEWEGFATATRAAAAGGVTTIVDMPLNSIPATTTVAGLAAKRAAAAGRAVVDVAFWGGVVPGNVDQLEPLAEAGVRGFKCFMSPSGVDEFPAVGEADLRAALPVLAKLGLPLLVHAEDPALLGDPRAPVDGAPADPRRYRTWLNSRPPASECAAIALLIALAREYGCRVHIVHVATAEALPAIAQARAAGVQITAETCPHYLTFAAEDIADGATAFKCAPPIRDRRERELLWKGLADGQLDFVASDHSPAPPDLKHLADGDFIAAWGGIASLQLALPAVWTGMAQRNLPLSRVAEWLSARPARLAGLEATKGRIAVGADADLVIWDPDATVTVDARTLFHRHPVTPYDGATLRGRVRMTLARGEIVYEPGRRRGVPNGRLL